MRGRLQDQEVSWLELDGKPIARIDGEPLFAWADAAFDAIDARIAAGDLLEEAVDDQDVRKHYPDAAELVDDLAGSKRSLSADAEHDSYASREDARELLDDGDDETACVQGFGHLDVAIPLLAILGTLNFFLLKVGTWPQLRIRGPADVGPCARVCYRCAHEGPHCLRAPQPEVVLPRGARRVHARSP